MLDYCIRGMVLPSFVNLGAKLIFFRILILENPIIGMLILLLV